MFNGLLARKAELEPPSTRARVRMGLSAAAEPSRLRGCGEPLMSPASHPFLALLGGLLTAALVSPDPGRVADVQSRRPEGFQSVSLLEFPGAEELEHVLEATYVLPDRARWCFGLTGEPGRRRLRYRSEDRTFGVDESSARSVEYEGGERLAVLRQMELRRAVWLFPETLEWTGAGPERRADLGELGSLVARMDGSGRPVRVDSLDAEGELVESLDELTWREQRGRWWPASLSLRYRGELIWRERVGRIDTRVRLLDSFFLPPDRRAGRRGVDAARDQVLHLDLPPVVQRRLALKARNWRDALAEAATRREEVARELAPRGLALSRALVLELSAAGEPTHALLRMSTRPEEPPPGWEVHPDRPALCRAVKGYRAVHPELVSALVRHRPPDAGSGSPYLRLSPDRPEEGRAQLVLPLELPEDPPEED